MKIVKVPNANNENYYTITITADSNDGDYVTAISKLSEDEFEEALPAIEYIYTNCFGSHNFEKIYGDCPEKIEESLDDINLPYGEMGGCHTLSYISIMYYEASGMNYIVKVIV